MSAEHSLGCQHDGLKYDGGGCRLQKCSFATSWRIATKCRPRNRVIESRLLSQAHGDQMMQRQLWEDLHNEVPVLGLAICIRHPLLQSASSWLAHGAQLAAYLEGLGWSM